MLNSLHVSSSPLHLFLLLAMVFVGRESFASVISHAEVDVRGGLKTTGETVGPMAGHAIGEFSASVDDTGSYTFLEPNVISIENSASASAYATQGAPFSLGVLATSSQSLEYYTLIRNEVQATAVWNDRIYVESAGPITVRLYFQLDANLEIEIPDPQTGLLGAGIASLNVTVNGSSFDARYEKTSGITQYDSAFSGPGLAEDGSFVGTGYFNVIVSEPTETPGVWAGSIAAHLSAYVQTQGNAEATADASHTFYFTNVTLVDGTSLEDAGLAFSYQSQQVPETSTVVLVSLGLLLVSLPCRLNSSRRAA